MAVFIAYFENVAVSAAQDLIELNAPTAQSVRIHRIRLTSDKTTTEKLRIALQESTGASGSGGTTATAQNRDINSSETYGGTVEVNNTTEATTLTVIEPYIWNILVDADFNFTPEQMIRISGGDRFLVTLLEAPSASTDMSGYIIFEAM